MAVKTVLLVDDDPNARDIYGTALRRAGYRVLEGENGHDGVRLARDKHPDLIILDLEMPELDGWKAMEILRSEPDTRRATIITLTVVGVGDDRRDPVRRGFDGHYVKPLMPDQLLPIVEKWIGPAR